MEKGLQKEVKREVKNSTIYGDWNVNSSWINASWQRGEVEWEGERQGREGGKRREGGREKEGGRKGDSTSKILEILIL